VTRSRAGFWVVAVGALVAFAIFGVAFGAVSLSISDVWDAVTGNGPSTSVTIVRTLRLPRVVLAALAGAGLGMSGAALQGALRNPLAEPYLLGVSGGAAVGAVVAGALGLVAVAIVPIAAFAGAIAAATLVVAVAAAAGGRADPRVLVMAGVVIGAFANAVIMVVFAGLPPDATRGALWWMMGSVSGASWQSVGWLAAYLAIGAGLLLHWASDIDLLALGDDAAAALGVDVERASQRIYLLSALIAAATVAAAGLIGFVGLVVPNLVRGLAGRGNRATVAGAGIVGAALLIGADIVARTLRAPAELPVGAVTAVIGVPFYLVRLRRFR
jgi:iron complex transport system permease protein